MTLHSQRFATETLIRLSEKIPNIEIILEYSIKPYRVDAYLPDHNISIEIDENDHAVYDPEKEFERSRYITNTLHCSWIRVNNSDSIENTVEQLLKQLKYYGISPTTIVPQELIKESQLPSGNTLQNKSYVQQLREFKAQQAEEAAKLELERLQQLETINLDSIRLIDEFISKYFVINNADTDIYTVLKDLSLFINERLSFEQRYGNMSRDVTPQIIRDRLQRTYGVKKTRKRIGGKVTRIYVGLKCKSEDAALT